VAEPGVWRDDNIAPFWSPDASRAISSPSFDDYVRTIDPGVDPDIWREYSVPQYDSYPVPYDPRAAALGAFRIPGMPEDAAEWELRERSPAGADATSPTQLAAMWNRIFGLELGADFTPSPRGGYPGMTRGGGGGGGGGGAGGGTTKPGSGGGAAGSGSNAPKETPASQDPGRDELAKVWRRYGGAPESRSAEGAPASAFVGRTGAGASPDRRMPGTPLGSHTSPPRNPPGVLIPSGGAKPIRSTAHGMDKVQDQGYVPSVIDQTRRSNNKKLQHDGSWLHYDPINDIFAVFNETGELRTTYPNPKKKKTK
jgi:hypothetical protein